MFEGILPSSKIRMPGNVDKNRFEKKSKCICDKEIDSVLQRPKQVAR